MKDITHINDPEFLKELIALYESTIARLTRSLEAAHNELARLRGDKHIIATQQELFDLKTRLEALQKTLYDASSERRTDNDSTDEKSKDSSPKQKKKQRVHGLRPQPSLPIMDEFHLFDQADLTCPLCGKDMRINTNLEEISFEVDIIPAQVILKRHILQKAACAQGCTMETAAGPLKLIPGGRYSVNFALEVACARYLEHLPLERLRRRFQRLGLTVSVQTLFDQLYAAASPLIPTWAALHAHLLRQEQLFGDETPWRLFTPQGRQSWYLWSLNAPEAAWYTFADSRSALISRQLLMGFNGNLQCAGVRRDDSFSPMNRPSSTRLRPSCG